MTPTDAAAYAARLERVREASLEARQPKADRAQTAVVDEDAVAASTVDDQSPEAPQPAPISSPDEGVDLPPPPVVLVRRLVEPGTPPIRQNGKRMALGIDPLDEFQATRGLKSSIEKVVAGLAERRDSD
jgi:hypothetical protein